MPLAASSRAPVDVVIDFSVPGRRRRDRRDLPGAASCRWSWPRPASTDSQQEMLREAAARDSAALVAQHEPGGEPGDEAGRDRRQALAGPSIGRRRRDHRAASSLQGRLAQRHGPEVRRDHRRRDGADRRIGTAARAGPASGRTARSAITPSASATIRASTRSSSACWAKRSSSPSGPPTATATPTAPWPPPSFWPASRPGCTA